MQRKAAGAARAAAVPTWTSAGPDGGIQVEEATYTGTPAFVSGRTTSLVPGRTCRTSGCVLYAGTAGGGLWKTSNALAEHPTWTHIGSGIPSTAIGTLYRAPNDGGFYVGTGEPNGSSDSEAGLGLYKSTDGARSFRKVQTFANGKDFTLDRSVAAVAVDPNNARHILVGTAVARHGSSSVNGGRFTPPGAAKVGLYETRDGGQDVAAHVEPGLRRGRPELTERGGLLPRWHLEDQVRPDPQRHRLRRDVRLRPVPRGYCWKLQADLHDQDPG